MKYIAELNALPPIKERTRLIVGDALAIVKTGWRNAATGDSILMSFDPVAHDTVGLQLYNQMLTAEGDNPAGVTERANAWLNASADPGRRLSFWQNRYLVQVRARPELDDATLRGFAQAIAMALPVGDETPALVKRLPPDGLVERSAVFFHEEISIQNKLWLGGENVLGLSPETNGVLAQYDLGGETPVWLLLAQYPDADLAAAGISALEAASVDTLVSVGAQDNLLGAVFGAIPGSMAGQLLTEALQ